MTGDELTQAAIDYLGRAFTAKASESAVPPPQMVQAAVSILLDSRTTQPVTWPVLLPEARRAATD